VNDLVDTGWFNKLLVFVFVAGIARLNADHTTSNVSSFESAFVRR